MRFHLCILFCQWDRDSKLSMLRPYAEELSVLEEERKQREAKNLQVTCLISKERLKHVSEMMALTASNT